MPCHDTSCHDLDEERKLLVVVAEVEAGSDIVVLDLGGLGLAHLVHEVRLNVILAGLIRGLRGDAHRALLTRGRHRHTSDYSLLAIRTTSAALQE